MLKVEHVTFRYERRGAPVLRDASLSLETGQVGVLLGRNGCGKTTLLKTTLGLCTPEQGQILFDGQALGAMKRQQRAQVAAYVPQELQFGALRVYDAVLAGRVSRFGIQPGTADRTAAEAALADMDLTALAERNVQTLSGGERQKVAIARRWPRSRSCWYSTSPQATWTWPTSSGSCGRHGGWPGHGA